MSELSHLSNLATAGRPLAIIIAAYYAVRAVIFLAAGIVALHTKSNKRREACLEMMRITSLGWPRFPRRPGAPK